MEKVTLAGKLNISLDAHLQKTQEIMVTKKFPTEVNGFKYIYIIIY